MKKILSLVAVMMLSLTALADSYTITFKNTTGGDGSAAYTTSTPIENVIESGAEYVSAITEAAYVYAGKDGFGAKFGSAKAMGHLNLALSALGKVKADKVVISVANYSAEQAYVQVNDVYTNGKTGTEMVYACPTGGALTEYELAVTGDLTNLDITNWSIRGRFYMKSITVHYTPAAISFDAEKCYAPVENYPGQPYQVVLGTDLATKKPNADGVDKNAINDVLVPWIVYNNATSVLADGTNELSAGNRYSAYDPFTGEAIAIASDMKMLANSANAWIAGYPTIEAAKSMDMYIKDTKKISIILTGAGSSETANVADIEIYENGGSEVITYTTEAMPGKSQAAQFYDPAAFGSKQVKSIKYDKELDATKEYKISIKAHDPAAGSVAFIAAHLYGTNDVPGHVAYGEPNVPSYTFWQTITGPYMLTNKTNVDGATKTAIDDATYPWIDYTRTDGIKMTDGTEEVQGAARYTTIDPVTNQECAAKANEPNGAIWNDPIVDHDKTIHFYVKNTAKFNIHVTGSSSNTAQLKVKATPIGLCAANVEKTSKDIANKSSKADGSQSNPDVVSLELNPNMMYHVSACSTVENGSLAIMGINLFTEAGAADDAAGKGTLNALVEKATTATVELEAGKEYTLNGPAAVKALEVVTINGNGATIKSDATGQLVAQKGIIVDNVVVDAAEATVAFIGMATTGEPSLSTYTEEVSHAATQEDVDAGKATAIGEKVVDVASAPKYEGANQTMFEAEIVKIANSTIKDLKAALITANGQKWAVKDLALDNNIIQFNCASISGQAAAIDMTAIKNLKISNSTIYNTNPSTSAYFVRLANASNAVPNKVWGTGATGTVDLQSNTFCNAMGHKDFANNYVNNGIITQTWNNNVFYNVFRLQKLMQNCSFDKTGMKETNILDHAADFDLNTSDTSYAYEYATGLVAPVNEVAPEGEESSAKALAPAATDLDALGEFFGLNTTCAAFGDPRWAPYSTKLDPVVSINAVSAAAATGKAYNLAGQRVNANAKGIVIIDGKKYINK